jgi:2'-5' RNA ligase
VPQSVWQEADALLATKPAAASVWDEADRVLAAEPPAPQTDLEREVVASSPASQSLKPTIADIFKLPAQPEIPSVPAPAPPPVRPPSAARGTAFQPPTAATVAGAARGAAAGVGDVLDAASGVLQAPVGALQALPAAAGEQLAGQSLPGHQNEPQTLFGRALEHLQMTARGQGGAVVPPSAFTPNPPDTGAIVSPTAAATARVRGTVPPQPEITPPLERGVEELTGRGLATAAKMLQDPAFIAMGLVDGAGEAVAAVNSAIGVKAAVDTAQNPNASPVDIAEGVVNALIASVPMGAQLAREASARARVVAQRFMDDARAAASAVRENPDLGVSVKLGPLEIPLRKPAPVEERAALPPHVEELPPAPAEGEPAAPPPADVWAEADRVLETPPKPAPVDETLDRYIEKYAKGEPLGSPELRQAFEERSRVEDARAQLSEEMKQQIDQLLEEEPHAVQEQGTGESRVRGLSGPGDEEESGAVGGRDAGGDHIAPGPREGVAAPEEAEADRLGLVQTVAPTTDREPHEFASTQVNLPPALADQVRELAARIPDEHLAEDGREEQPHITVKFGLHDNDPAAVARALEGEGPLTLRLGKTSIFPNGESGTGDVVKVDIDSPDLHRLNEKIAALPHTDTHPTYVPHATLAYVKPGLGERYAGDASLEGQTATIDRIVFTGKHREQIEIPLRVLPQPSAETAADLPLVPPTPPRKGTPVPGKWNGLVPIEHPTLPPLAAGILHNAFPNFPLERWHREGQTLVQTPDPALGTQAVALRIDLSGATPVVTSIGPKQDRQIANAVRQRFTHILKQHPELRRELAGATMEPAHEGQPAEREAVAVEGQQPEPRATERPAPPEPRPESGGQHPAGAQPRRPARAERAREAADLEKSGLDSLVEQAKAGGYAGDHEALRRELADRLQLIKEFDPAFNQASGHNPEHLLRAIAKAGGLSIKAETRSGRAQGGYAGEIKWLREFQDNIGGTRLHPRSAFGMVRGIANVFNERTGRSVDTMLEVLRQDPEFQHIETLGDLVEEIRAAATADEPGLAIDRLTQGLGERWWESIGRAAVEEAPAEETHGEAYEPEDVGDVTFNPDELEAEGLDVNEFGEVQPRLPEAGAVREQEEATPEFDAPFSLEAEADTTPRERTQDLFPPPKRSGGSGASMASTRSSWAKGPARAQVVPGLEEFVERDVVPTLKQAHEELGAAAEGVRAIWAPDTISAGAKAEAAIIRSNLAARRQRTARAAKAMQALERAWDKVPEADQLAFAMAVDEGRLEDLAPALRETAKLFKSINDQKRREANGLGGKVGYIEHYYPREWVRPGKVREFIQRALYGRRPLQGRGGFKKARARKGESDEIYSFRELYEAGFRPVETNPVRAHLRKWLEMDKWIAARRILLDGKRAGTTKFVRVGDDPPEGWQRYHDSFGTVYGPPTVTVDEAYDEILMTGLVRFAESLGIQHTRKVKIGGGAWGWAKDTKPPQVLTKFAGPEGVLMHEIGHVLDYRYGLKDQMVKDKRFQKELRALADLREEGTPFTQLATSRQRYLRKGEEKMANLVHAFIYMPERTKQVAPNSYWHLYNFAKARPELRPLIDLQKARSVKLGAATAEQSIGGLKIVGHYYGPPDAVRLLNNHLAPGVFGKNAAVDLYRRAGNLLNQVQLGLSGFHLVGTSLNSAFSQFAYALEEGSRGRFATAAREAIKTPIAPLLDIIEGSRALKHYYERDVHFREAVDDLGLIVRGGGGVGWDTFWHSSAPERFLQAVRGAATEAKAGNYPGATLRTALAAWRAVPALIELQAKPVMEWWVPRLKLAAYLRLARMEMRDLGEVPEELELRKVLGQAWDSIDNRFGELIYDNLFWHAVLKDAGMASVRALGWNVGTVREVAGALPAQLRATLKPEMRLTHTGYDVDAETGERTPRYEPTREPWLTHKAAYFVSLAFLSAVFGSLYQWFHTGLRPGEQEDGSTDVSTALLDLYFPRTGGTVDGRPERASLPTYIKDVYAMTRHPIETASHKLNPMLALLAEIARNQDYFGTAIRDADAPALEQLADVARYIASDYRPISLRSYYQRQEAKKPGAISAVESFLGINVAPASVTRTPLENYLHEINPPGPRTKEQAAAAQSHRDIRNALQEGDRDTARQLARDAGLSNRSASAVARAARLSSLQRSFQRTSLTQALHAYELATPEERTELRPLLARKAENAQVPPDERDALRRRLQALGLSKKAGVGDLAR